MSINCFNTCSNLLFLILLDNRPPSITLSPKVIRATAGQEIRVNVTVTDPDNDTIAMFMVQGLPEKNAMFTNTTPSGVFTWTPAVGLKKVIITFVAKDSKGKYGFRG